MNGQISIAEYLREKNWVPAAHCGSCICQSCLYWWSNRCPNSDCYLGRRPQVYGCQEGVVYPVHDCISFQLYQGQQVKECLGSAVSVFQDGYVLCRLRDSEDCTECYMKYTRRRNNDL